MNRLMKQLAEYFSMPLIYNLMVMTLCFNIIKYILIGSGLYDKILAILTVVALFVSLLVVEED